jgi:hypothetical protein
VCKLCRSTGFSVNATKKPANYPEEFFRRYPIPRSFVQMVLGRLRTDDIYNLIAEYPNPEHRSTALATQASMLYVMLYFAPEMLQNDQVRRRRVCVYVCVRRRREREIVCGLSMSACVWFMCISLCGEGGIHAWWQTGNQTRADMECGGRAGQDA